MNLVDGITDQAKQTTTLILADGSRATLTLEFRPNQRGWFCDVARNDFLVEGLRVTATPNFLRQFRKLVPFGLAVLTVAGVEPLNQSDFADGTATLYLLDAADVVEIEATIFAGS